MSADLEHVITATGIHIVAIRINLIFVAAFDPCALKRRQRFLTLVPVQMRCAGTLNVQIANFSLGDRMSLLVTQFNGITGYGFACCAIAQIIAAVREKYMQHFRRAQTIQNLAADLLTEFFADFLGKCLTGGNAQAQIDFLALGQRIAGQHSNVQGGNAVKNGWSVFLQALKYGLRCRSLSHQQSACTDGQGEGQCIAQSVGKKQFGS